ncbi:serine hydrolase domain-containing protein [Pedobacter psychrodurus]|uniref:serine hydrolase domain-containing protein n=1 Tax=Pedobacter psychrodurus TaxID=2530456 RepID=UPI00292E0942|nr:serine hydrolase domain-containing protein [Pedobacter psychrodurus]
MQKLKLITIICLLLVVHSKTSFSQSKEERLTQSLKAVFEKDSLPGISVILTNTKKVVYEQNFGFANVEENIKYTSHSIQNIGSVSKTFIAIALMKAIELGYFNLETDINTILPFKVINPNDPAGVITIRQLTNHTSGIIDNPAIFPNVYHFNTSIAPYDTAAYKILQDLGYQQKISDTSLASFMHDYLAQKGQHYHKENFGTGASGTTSSYSNIASALAAYLIELKSGLSYADFTKKYILKPLKMNQSGWQFDRHNLKNYARPYYSPTAVFPYYDFITYPEGGLRTNTADLSKYIMAMLRAYHGDQSLLKKASVDSMFRPQFSKIHPPKGISLVNRNKGIFWNLYTNGTIGHDGDDPGVSSFLFFNPKTGLGGIFLCNKYLADKTAIINLLVQYTNEK